MSLQKIVKDKVDVDHGSLQEVALQCVHQGVIPDQKYNMQLRKCLAIISKVDAECVLPCVRAAASLAPGDWRATCAMLEVLAKQDSGTVLRSLPPDFLESAFRQLSIQNDRSGLVGRFLASALVKSDMKTVYSLISAHMNSEGRPHIMTYFVTPWLKLRSDASAAFPELFNLVEDGTVQVAMLKAARSANLDVAAVIYSSTSISAALKSWDVRCRLDALELLCSATRKLTAPIPSAVFQLLTENMGSYLGSGEPRSRADAAAALSHLFERTTKQRYKASSQDTPEFTLFLKSLHKWCALSLRPGSPYRYQAMAMLALQTLHVHGYLEVAPLQQALITCVGSTYNDIREAAISFIPRGDVPGLEDRAFDLALSTRTSETGAQFLKFIGPCVIPRVFTTLEAILDECIDTGVDSVSSQKCLHGLFTALRLLPRSPGEEYRCVISCLKAWDLCSPYSFQRPPRQVLDFCWKAVKESCELVAVLNFASMASDDSEGVRLRDHTLRRLADLFVNTTHWGALAAVPGAFINVGQYNAPLSLGLAKEPLASLARGKEIRETTRRSAGLPMLMQSALCIKFDESLVEYAFSLAEQDQIEVSVHGMNCVKGILNDSNLNRDTKRFVEPALQLAIQRFDSQSWPLRNCAAMLFSTLLRRIFGPQNSPVPAPAFFHDHRNIHGLLVSMLKNADANTELHSVYPTLALLTRLRPGNKDHLLRIMVDDVLKLLGSKNWQVRAMAAQAVSGMVQDKNSVALHLMQSMSLSNHNQLHGFSVGVYHLISTSADDITVLMNSPELERVRWLIANDTCLETKASLYAFYCLLRAERVLKFADLRRLSAKRGLNPSVDVFEGMQALESADGVDIANYSTRTAVLRKLPLVYWTPKLSLDALRYDHPPDVHSRAFSIGTKDDALRNIAKAWAMNEKKPIKTRHAALLYFCRSQVDELPSGLADLILEFSESDDVESRKCAADSIQALSAQSQQLHLNAQLHYALFRLLSDDEENIRRCAAFTVYPDGLSEFECEKIMARKIPAEFLINKLSEGIEHELTKAIDGFQSSDLFLVERDGQYRDELRLLEIMKGECKLERVASTETPVGVSAASERLSSFDFQQPFGSQADANLLLLKERVEAVLDLLNGNKGSC